MRKATSGKVVRAIIKYPDMVCFAFVGVYKNGEIIERKVEIDLAEWYAIRSELMATYWEGDNYYAFDEQQQMDDLLDEQLAAHQELLDHYNMERQSLWH